MTRSGYDTVCNTCFFYGGVGESVALPRVMMEGKNCNMSALKVAGREFLGLLKTKLSNA